MFAPWSVREVAQLYDVSPVTVYGWLKRGLLKGRQDASNGRWEIPQRAIVAFTRPARGRPKAASDQEIPDPRHYYSSADLVKRYRVHPGTITRWVRQGHLPAFRAGPKGHWYVKADDLAQFEEDRDCFDPLPSQYLDYDPSLPSEAH